MTRQRYTLAELDEWIVRLKKEVDSTEDGSREHRSATHDLERVETLRRIAVEDAKERESNSNLSAKEIVDRINRW